MVYQIRKNSRSNLWDKSSIALSSDDNRGRFNRLMQICKGSMPCWYCITQWQAKHKRTTYSVSQCSLPTILITQLSRWAPIDVYSRHICTYQHVSQLNFISSLKDHLLSRLLNLDFDGNKQPFTPDQWIATLEPQSCHGIQNLSSQLFYLQHLQKAQLLIIWPPFLSRDILKGRSIQPIPLLVLSITQSVQH